MEETNFGQVLPTVLSLDSMKKIVQKDLMKLDIYIHRTKYIHMWASKFW